MIDQRFGRWTIIDNVPSNKEYKRYLCKCDCDPLMLRGQVCSQDVTTRIMQLISIMEVRVSLFQKIGIFMRISLTIWDTGQPMNIK
jgi:hypothetical protein